MSSVVVAMVLRPQLPAVPCRAGQKRSFQVAGFSLMVPASAMNSAKFITPFGRRREAGVRVVEHLQDLVGVDLDLGEAPEDLGRPACRPR